MRRNSGRLSVVPLIAWSAYTATTGQPSEAACARHTRTWSSMDSSRWLWDENRAYIAAACAIMSLPSLRGRFHSRPRAGLPPICARPISFRCSSPPPRTRKSRRPPEAILSLSAVPTNAKSLPRLKSGCFAVLRGGRGASHIYAARSAMKSDSFCPQMMGSSP